MAGQGHDGQVRLGVGGHEGDRLPCRHDRQRCAAQQRRDRQAGGEELAAVHVSGVRATCSERSLDPPILTLVVHEEIVDLMSGTSGHFRFESGHHGELWLEPDSLFVRSDALARPVAELARRLSAHGVEAVCGPLVGGAFLAQMLAARLEVEFLYAEPSAWPQPGWLFLAGFRLPPPFRRPPCRPGRRGRRRRHQRLLRDARDTPRPATVRRRRGRHLGAADARLRRGRPRGRRGRRARGASKSAQHPVGAGGVPAVRRRDPAGHAARDARVNNRG